MKATKLLIATAAFAGLASLSFPGPGPEYWARMNSAAKKPTAQPAGAVTTTCASCACCANKV